MPHPTRVALITGCGKPIGIGNSTARALAAAGVTVVVSDVAPAGVANEHNVQGDMDPNWGGLDSLVEAITQTGGTASAAIGSVSVEADAARMVDEVLRRYGRLDILVNNAGAPQGADRNEIEDVPVAAWDLTMGVNARGCFLMSRAAVPAMRKAGWGRIVSVSSRAAFRPGPRRVAYAASKAAIVGMTKTIARGYAGEGILCFGVAPGFTVSEMTADYLQGRGGAQIVADIPLGRVASTDEVAEVIRWLATEAPASATGSVIDVNGASYVR